MNQSTQVLATEQLSFSYAPKANYIFENLNFNLHAGECVAILGPSGVGKSTLVNLLASLDSPTQGKIHYQLQTDEQTPEQYIFENNQLYIKTGDNRDIADRDDLRQHFGFVFQTPFMLTNFNVRYNIGLPLRLKGKTEDEIAPKVEKLLTKLNLQNQAEETADKLSGGQRQRVAIGRALIHEPDIIFADEPTGNLDNQTAKEIMEVLTQLVKEKHSALILITHDPCVAAYAQRIFFLQPNKEGAQLQLKQWTNQSQREQCCHQTQSLFEPEDGENALFSNT